MHKAEVAAYCAQLAITSVLDMCLNRKLSSGRQVKLVWQLLVTADRFVRCDSAEDYILSNAVQSSVMTKYSDEQRTSCLLGVDSARFPWPAASCALQTDMDATPQKVRIVKPWFHMKIKLFYRI